jgi:hypothetical protein
VYFDDGKNDYSLARLNEPDPAKLVAEIPSRVCPARCPEVRWGTVILGTSGKWIYEKDVEWKDPDSVGKMNDWRADVICSHLTGLEKEKEGRIMKDPALVQKGFENPCYWGRGEPPSSVLWRNTSRKDKPGKGLDHPPFPQNRNIRGRAKSL